MDVHAALLVLSVLIIACSQEKSKKPVPNHDAVNEKSETVSISGSVIEDEMIYFGGGAFMMGFDGGSPQD